MENEIQVVSGNRPSLTASEIRSQVNLIQEVMKSVMKQDTHYGVIPGCHKPSLWKPGAEKLLMTFRVASDPEIQDLSTPDCARFRVTRKGFSILTGAQVGSAVGECSSDEEKYKWRKSVCDEEYNESPEDRRREKWIKPYQKEAYKVKQIRTNQADVANTILKMADKRAYVALALNVTAAGDIFTQDIEDLPQGMAAEQEPAPAPIPSPKPANNGKMISEPQRKRFYAIWKGAGKTEDEVRAHLKASIGSDHSNEIPADKYEEVCEWASKKTEDIPL